MDSMDKTTPKSIPNRLDLVPRPQGVMSKIMRGGKKRQTEERLMGLVAIPLAQVDLAQSMIVHNYPMEEICRRTGISPRQVEGLIEAYEWKADTLPLYDRRIIDSGADPETAREFYQILKGLAEEGESTDPVPRRCDIEKVRKNPPMVEAPVDDFLSLFQAKTVPAQHYILRAIENGVPIESAFGCLGFDLETMKAWLGEDKWFKATFARVVSGFGVKFFKKIEKAADSDWKAAAFVLNQHPNTRDEWGPRAADEGGKTISVTMNFQRTREIPEEFIGAGSD